MMDNLIQIQKKVLDYMKEKYPQIAVTAVADPPRIIFVLEAEQRYRYFAVSSDANQGTLLSAVDSYMRPDSFIYPSSGKLLEELKRHCTEEACQGIRDRIQ